jgi:hypothetical protein
MMGDPRYRLPNFVSRICRVSGAHLIWQIGATGLHELTSCDGAVVAGRMLTAKTLMPMSAMHPTSTEKYTAMVDVPNHTLISLQMLDSWLFFRTWDTV